MISTQSRSFQVTMLAPGFALQSKLVEVAEEQENIVLRLRDGSGNLEVVGPPSLEPGERIILTQDGYHLPFHLYYEWARGHGVLNTDTKVFKLPNVLPAFYQVCLHSPEKVLKAVSRGETWREALHRCTEGYLENGQTLRFEIAAEAGVGATQ